MNPGNLVPSLSASNMVNALEANLTAHSRLYSGLPGAISIDEPEITALMTGLDVSESCVYRAEFSPGQVGEKIEHTLARYRAHNCLPMWWI